MNRGARECIGEIALGLLPIVTIIWITPLLFRERAAFLQANFYLSLLAFVIAAVSNLRHRDTLKMLGVRLDNFLSALRVLALPTAIAGLVVVGVGLATDSLALGDRFLFHLRTLPPWALLQQYALQGFVHRRLQDAYGRGRKSILGTALIFSLLHLPNPVLTIGTFIGGAVWAWAFSQQPNLFALALSHTLVSALVANALPRSLLQNMKVGWGYWGQVP